MTRELALIITLAVTALILVSMVVAWRARLRRDAGLTAPLGVPEHAEVTSRHEVLYVATTRHDEPLERLAVKPLVYRARGEAVVTDRGLALSLDGAPTVFLASRRLVAVDRATVTIDRVVEPGGLVRVAWRIDDETIVDSYLRFIGDPAAVITELQRQSAAPDQGANE
ncbi:MULTISPECIES: PH-like domain-containing protein [unclassified Microbacterium]|uniref:PH-like domain-containing protein n=1 Tax=unclassified Microbacterium TaxID=2609290 RepID=UPI00300F8C57